MVLAYEGIEIERDEAFIGTRSLLSAFSSKLTDKDRQRVGDAGYFLVMQDFVRTPIAQDFALYEEVYSSGLISPLFASLFLLSLKSKDVSEWLLEGLPEGVEAIVSRWAASKEDFPVDFDLAWVLVGYSKKSNAKTKLEPLLNGEDFRVLNLQHSISGGGSRPEDIRLTNDGFKLFAAAAHTKMGDLTRRYLIQAEKKLKLIENGQLPRIDNFLASLEAETKYITSITDRIRVKNDRMDVLLDQLDRINAQKHRMKKSGYAFREEQGQINLFALPEAEVIPESTVRMSEPKRSPEPVQPNSTTLPEVDLTGVEGTWVEVARLVVIATAGTLTTARGYSEHLSASLVRDMPQYFREESNETNQLRRMFEVCSATINYVNADIDRYSTSIRPSLAQCKVQGIPHPCPHPAYSRGEAEPIPNAPISHKRSSISRWIMDTVRAKFPDRKDATLELEIKQAWRNLHDFLRTKISGLPDDKGKEKSWIGAYEKAGLLDAVYIHAHTYFKRPKSA
jgi:hypothetical protein